MSLTVHPTHVPQERIFYDKELENDYTFLKANGPADAEVGVVSRTLDELKWIINYFKSDGPTSYAIYDKPNQKITHLFVTNPNLLPFKFAPMEDVRIKARDGLELVGYVTRATTDGPSPLILLVHGGPWARDYWGFDAKCQWFANRGYSTLKVCITIC
jgi:dipeptidyl aminopeptidase/acylaminoacyl peptidase